jgi:V8-like Glu-specific endopeptidase
MIGRSTALGAAHCFFNNGWIATAWMAFGANNWGTMTTPFGTYVFDSITIPGQWNSNEWDFDFAVLEFSPTRYPGDQTGWLGTEWNMSGWQYEIGYPLDKVYPSQWATYGTYTASAGGRYEHNLDLVPGDSGACVYNASYRCTGIQSTQWDAGGRKWNEVRRWDSTTHNFFDAYGNWP